MDEIALRLEDTSHSRRSARQAIRDTRRALAFADTDDARHRSGEALGLRVPTDATFLQVQTPDDVAVRPMSLATSPTRSHLEYGVHVSNSAFRRTFVALQPGHSVVIQGPLGHYILDERRPAVLVAGGIGITPLKGMAEYAAGQRLSIPIRLLYSNRTAEGDRLQTGTGNAAT